MPVLDYSGKEKSSYRMPKLIVLSFTFSRRIWKLLIVNSLGLRDQDLCFGKVLRHLSKSSNHFCTSSFSRLIMKRGYSEPQNGVGKIGNIT
jgi:hypothetical protein